MMMFHLLDFVNHNAGQYQTLKYLYIIKNSLNQESESLYFQNKILKKYTYQQIMQKESYMLKKLSKKTINILITLCTIKTDINKIKVSNIDLQFCSADPNCRYFTWFEGQCFLVKGCESIETCQVQTKI